MNQSSQNSSQQSSIADIASNYIENSFKINSTHEINTFFGRYLSSILEYGGRSISDENIKYYTHLIQAIQIRHTTNSEKRVNLTYAQIRDILYIIKTIGEMFDFGYFEQNIGKHRLSLPERHIIANIPSTLTALLKENIGEYRLLKILQGTIENPGYLCDLTNTIKTRVARIAHSLKDRCTSDTIPTLDSLVEEYSTQLLRYRIKRIESLTEDQLIGFITYLKNYRKLILNFSIDYMDPGKNWENNKNCRIYSLEINHREWKHIFVIDGKITGIYRAIGFSIKLNNGDRFLIVSKMGPGKGDLELIDIKNGQNYFGEYDKIFADYVIGGESIVALKGNQIHILCPGKMTTISFEFDKFIGLKKIGDKTYAHGIIGGEEIYVDLISLERINSNLLFNQKEIGELDFVGSIYNEQGVSFSIIRKGHKYGIINRVTKEIIGCELDKMTRFKRINGDLCLLGEIGDKKVYIKIVTGEVFDIKEIPS